MPRAPPFLIAEDGARAPETLDLPAARARQTHGALILLVLAVVAARLDIAHRFEVMEIAQGYAARGGGAVAVMHDLNRTAMHAARVSLMSAGRVAASGTVAEVIRDDHLSRTYCCVMRMGHLPEAPACFLPLQGCSVASALKPGETAVHRARPFGTR